ncbi:MAG: transglycosylase domain-containing protein [Acidimicrobiales bacterium]
MEPPGSHLPAGARRLILDRLPGRSRAKGSKRRSVFWRWRRFFFLLGLAAVGGIAGAGWVVSQIELPEAEVLLETSYVCAGDVTEACGADNAIAELSGHQNRTSVSLDQVPDVLIDAVLAQEDRTFFDHSGVDVVSIARALWTDLRHQTLAQGGSTVTQQYVKNVYLTDDRTLLRKIREAALAIRLERDVGKEEILERYLNTIYFGRGAYGVEAASRAYFDKSVEDLALPEAAFMAGLIRAPETADPSRDLTEAERRRNNALVRMVADGHITQAEMDAANAVPLDEITLPRSSREGLGNVRGSEYGTEYFVDQVRQQLIDELGAATVYGGGLRIYTTLDPGLQEAAHRSVTDVLDPANPDDPEAAVVTLDDQNQVVAMVGGTDFAESQVNLAMGRDGGGSGRGPGSAYKPFALAQALVDGWGLGDTVPAPSQAVFEGADDGGDWRVTGGGSPVGRWSLVDATRVSSNTGFAHLMLELGPARVNELARGLGITHEVPDVPSVVLGAGEVSVFDMASAYSSFRDQGRHTPPAMVVEVTDASGRIVWRPDRAGTRVLDPEVADQVTYALTQVVEGGTGRNAAVPGQFVAGKTGTTTNNRDAWFVGYTCRLSTAVWMGHPTADDAGNPRTMSNFRGISVTGGSFPAQIWSAYMTAATEGSEPCPFPDVSVPPTTTSTTELRCPVDATDTTDPDTPIELCPSTTVDDDGDDDDDEDDEDGDDDEDVTTTTSTTDPDDGSPPDEIPTPTTTTTTTSTTSTSTTVDGDG